MAGQPAQLPAHLALRIALAARAFKGLPTAHLLQALLAVSGEPLNETRLSKLRATRLRRSLDEVLELAGLRLQIDEAQMQRAMALLKGRGVQMPEDAVPEPQAYREGELGDSIRIACASDSGERLDGRFGTCARFLIYQVCAHASRLIELRQPSAAETRRDRYSERAELLGDCQLLYTLSIGSPAVAKVVRAGVHPVRVAAPVPVSELIEALQQVLLGTPPPWLAKAMVCTAQRCNSEERE